MASPWPSYAPPTSRARSTARPLLWIGMLVLILVVLAGLALAGLSLIRRDAARVYPADPPPPVPGNTEFVPEPPHVQHAARAGDLRLTWTMPQANLIDGPKEMNSVPAPAIGTFWSYGGSLAEFRYDVLVLEHTEHLGADDSERAINSMEDQTLHPVQSTTGRTEFRTEGWFDDRVYHSHVISFDGTIVELSVATPDDREDLEAEAVTRLDALVGTFEVEPY